MTITIISRPRRNRISESIRSMVRESHLIDGQTVNVNEQFTLLSGNKAYYPGDPNLPPEDRVNERCFLAYHNGVNSLAGISEEQRTAYWNTQRAEMEAYKKTMREGYKKIFEEMSDNILEVFNEK